MKLRMKNLLFFYFIFGLYLQGKAQQDTLILSGYIDVSFHLSSTHLMNPNMRMEIDSAFSLFEENEELISRYIKEFNKGEHVDREFLSVDKRLYEMSSFELHYIYAMYRMRELNVLYTPLFTIYDIIEDVDTEKGGVEFKNIVISSTVEQLEKIKKSMKRMTYVCVYVGELSVDDLSCYRLVELK